MDLILTLMAGILIAATVFVATVWSGYRAATTRGWPRRIHVALVLVVLLGMGALEFEQPDAARLIGIAGLVPAAAGLVIEERWTRLLPLAQLLFAAALIAGLPFGG